MGKHFIIDPTTRIITSTSDENVLIQGDHNSERYTFEIPRFIDGHDMYVTNRIEIHYDNIAKDKSKTNEGLYISDDIVVNGDNIEFSWLVSRNATQLAGKTQFWINFICIDDDDNIIYSWGTRVYKSINIIQNNHNTEEITIKLPDLLSQWKDALLNGEVANEKITQAVTDYFDQNSVSSASIGVVELLADKWVGSDNLYYQVVSIDGVTENSQVDLTPSVEQLVVFYEKDLTFVTENDGGMVIVYAIGQKPANDYTIQVTITEVYV
jgi:hypothetical protein